MRTKDELFRAAQREIAARRQHAVMQAETARRAAYAANPALSAADDAKMRAGLSLARTAALGGDMDAARAALEAADKAAAEAAQAAGFSEKAFAPKFRCPLCQDTGMRGESRKIREDPRQGHRQSGRRRSGSRAEFVLL